MNEYVLKITLAIIFCVGINILIPSQKYAGIMKIICGILVVYVVLSPLKNILLKDVSFKVNEDYFKISELESRVDKSREEFGEILTGSSNEIFLDIIKDDIKNLCDLDADIEITDNVVYISRIDAENQPLIQKYIKEQYGLDTIFR